MIQFRRIGLAAIAAIALLMMPLAASAATNGTASQSIVFTGGSLSISTPADTVFTSTALSAGTLSAAVNQAQWTDATSTGNGWNGTIAMTRFHVITAWTPGSTASPLLSNVSGQFDDNSTSQPVMGAYNVVVTAQAAGTVTYSVSGQEVVATSTATKGVATAIGTKGVTITFAIAQTYIVGDSYSAKVGLLGGTALALNSTLTTITPTSNSPVAVGGSSTVPAYGGVATYGTPVKFVSAAAGNGMGTYTVTPGVTLTWIPASTWAAAYTASAQYTIVSGP